MELEPDASIRGNHEEDIRNSHNCDTLPLDESCTPEGTTISFDQRNKKKSRPMEGGKTGAFGNSNVARVISTSAHEDRKRRLDGGNSGKTKQQKIVETNETATLIFEPNRSTDEDMPLLINDALHGEDEKPIETASSSQKTEVYLDDNDDWLQDVEFFEKVVKQNSLKLASSQSQREENTGNLQNIFTADAEMHNTSDTKHKCDKDIQNQKDSKSTTDIECEHLHFNSYNANTPIPTKADETTKDDDVKDRPTLIRKDGMDSADGAKQWGISSSIHQDALKISELLEGIEFDRIVRKVQSLQSVPDRVQVAIEELLEEPNSTTCNTHTQTSQVKPSLHMIESVKVDAEQIATILGLSGVGKIYEKVKEQRSKSNRVELVTNQILEQGALLADRGTESGSSDGKRGDEEEGDCLLQDVTRVLDLLKTTNSTLNVDPNDVYQRLETATLKSNRVQCVVADLVSMGNMEKPAGDSVQEGTQTAAPMALRHRDSDLTRDPLFRDTQILAKIFPHKDQNEIFAHLEAYYNRPNRVALVTEEFLHVEGNSQDSQEKVGHSDATDGMPVPTPAGTDAASDFTKDEPDDILEKFRQNVDALKEIFPDCDPEYIVQQLQVHFDEPDRLATISSHMFAHRNYPRLKDRLDKDKKKLQRERLLNLDITLQEFLNMFPDPVTHFYDETKQVSETYKQHAKIQLRNDFQLVRVRYIEWVWEEHNFHYTPTVRGIRENLGRMSGKLRSKRTCNQPRAFEDGWPDELDDYFFRELFFARHEEEIINFITLQEEYKTRHLQEAREKGELHECGCCFDDEVLFEDMQACPDGHLFCSECVRRSAEAAIGEGKVKFLCLQGECLHDFKLVTLQAVLSPSTFSLVLRKLQEEELRQADIPDLVICPFCPYATIMPDSSDKLLRCQNPECLKESCRLCGELNHIPLRCDEVEKDGETKMRIYIENKMAEAMLRTCLQCKKRFYKTVGCNKMTCVCGASMCYVCREPVTDYSHFEQSGRCSNVNNMDKLHEGEVALAARKAQEEYKRNHPELANIQLKHDPATKVSNAATYGEDFDDYYDHDEIESEEEYEDYYDESGSELSYDYQL